MRACQLQQSCVSRATSHIQMPFPKCASCLHDVFWARYFLLSDGDNLAEFPTYPLFCLPSVFFSMPCLVICVSSCAFVVDISNTVWFPHDPSKIPYLCSFSILHSGYMAAFALQLSLPHICVRVPLRYIASQGVQ
jgi:hypothetical protein